MSIDKKTIAYIVYICSRKAVTLTQRVIRTIPYRTARGAYYIGKIGNGELYNSIVTDNNIIGAHRAIISVYAAEHITYIDEGREPHVGDDSKLIPIQGESGRKFRNWAFKKKRNPYAVRRNIQKYGISPTPITKTIADTLHANLIDVAAESAIDNITGYVLSEIDVIFKNR